MLQLYYFWSDMYENGCLFIGVKGRVECECIAYMLLCSALSSIWKFCSGALKLQKERDETKEQRKKDKKKRNEKRKEKKERKEKESKAALHTDDKGKECKVENLESSKLEKVRTEQGTGCLQKVGNEENEQNERSAITEEHDQPFSSTEPCCLSDSTQTSNKRKRSESPCNSDHGE